MLENGATNHFEVNRSDSNDSQKNHLTRSYKNKCNNYQLITNDNISKNVKTDASWKSSLPLQTPE